VGGYSEHWYLSNLLILKCKVVLNRCMANYRLVPHDIASDEAHLHDYKMKNYKQIKVFYQFLTAKNGQNCQGKPDKNKRIRICILPIIATKMNLSPFSLCPASPDAASSSRLRGLPRRRSSRRYPVMASISR
jgi:hypothetical protein